MLKVITVLQVHPNTTFVLVCTRTRNTINPEPKGKETLRHRTSKTLMTTQPRLNNHQSRAFKPRFIPTCHHYSVVGHMKPKCHKLKNKGRGQDIFSQVSYLLNQVSHLTTMLTKMTRVTLTSRKIWVKKSDLPRKNLNLNCFMAHVVFKARNNSKQYLDSAFSRHMCGNKALFSTLDECNGSMVTIGDGATTHILGKNTVHVSRLLVISNVLYIEGLKYNLLSIS